jgi:hypothetical protein
MVSKPGDIAQVKIPKGNNKGAYIAQVANIRKTELFTIKPVGRKQTFTGTHKYCQIVLRPDD